MRRNATDDKYIPPRIFRLSRGADVEALAELETAERYSPATIK